MSVVLEWKGEEAREKLITNAIIRLNFAAESMQSLAKQLAPVDTGYMRDHIQIVDVATEDSLKSSVLSEADYSLYVEYGTINMEAQPFFTPAFESAKRQLLNMRIF